MANDFQYIADILVSLGVATLRQNAIVPRLVNVDHDAEAAQKNAVINVPIPTAIPTQDVTAGSANTPTDLTPSVVPITLDQWKEARFRMSDRAMAEVAMGRVMPMAAAEAIKSLANTIDAYCISKLQKGSYTVVNTTSPTALADVTGMRKALNVNLAPVTDRRLVMDPTVEEEMLRIDAFRDLDKTGQQQVLLEGTLGRRFGFDLFMDQNVGTLTAGTGANYVTNGVQALGTKSVVIKTGTGTVLVGDIVTFAGHSQTYVVTAGVAAAGTISIYPGLVVQVADAVAMSIKATHNPSVGFHRNAMAFAMRPLDVEVTPGVIISRDTDPISGVSLRVEVSRINKETVWSFDCLYGGAVVRPELIARLCD